MTQLMNMPTKHLRYIAVDNEGYITDPKPTKQDAIDELKLVFQCAINHHLETQIIEYRLIEVNTAFHTYDEAVYGDHISEHVELQNQPTTLDHLVIDPEPPDCKDKQHQFQSISIQSQNASIIEIDKCDKCDLERIRQTWQKCDNCNQYSNTVVKYIESDLD